MSVRPNRFLLPQNRFKSRPSAPKSSAKVREYMIRTYPLPITIGSGDKCHVDASANQPKIDGDDNIDSGRALIAETTLIPRITKKT
jgi:hypothetical protein